MKLLRNILSLMTIISMICGKLIYNRRHRLTHSEHLSNMYNELTVIIPARNEAKRLPHLLKSLQMQHGIYDIIVMDDCSSDDTKQIAESYGATVHELTEDENDGWVGKSYVCYQGAHKVETSLMMFVDADVTFHHPYTISSILSLYTKQGQRGLLSVQPYHQTKKFYEHFSAIFNLLTVVGMNRFSSLARQSDSSMAFGPVTLMNKEDYFITGGHKNAHNTIIEGFALGEAFKQAHLPVTLYEGGNGVQFRMYEEGIQSLIQGWTKHFSVGANQTQPQVMLAIMIWLMGSLTSTFSLILGFIVKPKSIVIASIVYILYTWEFIHLHRRVGSFSIVSLILHPILFLFFIIIFINSWLHVHFSKKVKWKGRTFNISSKF